MEGEQPLKKVTIYTDGACIGNPGHGGWAAILEFSGKKKEFDGGELATTNNRMELQAAIEALRKLKEPCEVELYTDSQYVREGISMWIRAWKAKGWKKKVKNKDLWQALDTEATRHKVIWHWVRGHSEILPTSAATSSRHRRRSPSKRVTRQNSAPPPSTSSSGRARNCLISRSYWIPRTHCCRCETFVIAS